MLPALGGKHDFESGTKAKSRKLCVLGPPIMPLCTLFALLIATWNLQSPLEKCVFFVYSPFSEAIFSIVCFIAWLRSEISIFCIASGLILCKMLAALITSKAKAHATHVSVAQHISKSTPCRYYSLQCKPSWFRPYAIAGFRLHASVRRSELVCRA